MVSRLAEAFDFAFAAHDGQLRRVSGAPFIVHPFEVMRLLVEVGVGEDVLVAALLHDILEDTSVDARVLRERFGERVFSLVSFCTEQEGIEGMRVADRVNSWHDRKQSIIDRCASSSDRDALLLELADKFANLSSLRDDLLIYGDEVWSLFHASKKDVWWYYSELGKIFVDNLSDVVLQKRYARLVREVFEELV